MERTLVHFNRARQELVMATKIDEVKTIRDKAEALRAYMKQAGAGLEMQNQCAEIKIRAEIRAGELLAETTQRGRPIINIPRWENNNLRLTYNQSSRWQSMARVPEALRERHIAEAKAEGQELTSAGMLRLAKRLQRAERKTIPPPFPIGTYSVLYADPPWSYHNVGFDQSAEAHYCTMSVEDICALPVPDLCTRDTVLFLWATSPLLPEALQVLEAWGFTYKASMVWDKGRGPTIGWFVKTEHELILIGTREGNQHPLVKPASILHIPRTGRHSEKPKEMYELIENMYGGPWCELFARNEREGWEAWGDELDKDS